jgi:hypothetical protein
MSSPLISSITVFPPTNNGERYAAAILEAIQALIAATERTTAEVAKLNAYIEAANGKAPNPEQLSFAIGIHRADPEDAAGMAHRVDTGTQDDLIPREVVDAMRHVQITRLRCSCGFSVNPKGYDKLRQHLEENNPKAGEKS